MSEKIEDEYRIKPILCKFDINNNNLTLALNEHLNKTVSIYLSNRKSIRKSAFTEIICQLQMALIDTRNNNNLKARITKIVTAIEKL